MSNLLYWVVPAMVVTLFGVLIALIERRPKGPTVSVDNFAKELNAMSSMKYTHTDAPSHESQKAV